MCLVGRKQPNEPVTRLEKISFENPMMVDVDATKMPLSNESYGEVNAPLQVTNQSQSAGLYEEPVIGNATYAKPATTTNAGEYAELEAYQAPGAESRYEAMTLPKPAHSGPNEYSEPNTQPQYEVPQPEITYAPQTYASLDYAAVRDVTPEDQNNAEAADDTVVVSNLVYSPAAQRGSFKVFKNSTYVDIV